ncbi:MAG: hypothetical protein ACREPM_24505 [Gemmatimonadaceae bacterium]
MSSHSMSVVARRALVFAGMVVSVACQSHDGQSSGSGQTTAVANATSAHDTAKGTTGMGGMSGMSMMNAAAMDSMHAELTRLRAMSPNKMKGAIPTHRQMTANMLSAMNADMRSMNMTGDPAWNTLVDSVRRDPVQLPDLPSTQLAVVLPLHAARVERLMTMHQQMMQR